MDVEKLLLPGLMLSGSDVSHSNQVVLSIRNDAAGEAYMIYSIIICLVVGKFTHDNAKKT